MPGEGHRKQRVASVPCAIITVSDSRTAKTDESGATIREHLSAAGHLVHSYGILPDDPQRVREHVLSLCSDEACRAVLISGGTGIADRDTTYEAVEAILTKRLDGFGELFRMLSYEAVGPAAMLSRALAGVCESTVIFSMPGSVDAVRLAMGELVIPELPHIVWLVRPGDARA